MHTKTKSETLEFVTPDGSCDAFAAWSESSEKLPAIVMYMDAIGLRPRLEDMAKRLASEGYFVLVPNLYYREHKAPVLNYEEALKPQNFQESIQQVIGIARRMLTPEVQKRDAAAFVRFLKERPEVDETRIAAVGYCMGGGIALRAAASYPEDFKAIATFHAGKLVTEDAESPHRWFPKIRAKVYIGHADQDPSMPAEMIVKVREELERANVKFEAELYVGAKHGWTMADLLAYNAEAEERHWAKLTSFLKKALVV